MSDPKHRIVKKTGVPYHTVRAVISGSKSQPSEHTFCTVMFFLQYVGYAVKKQIRDFAFIWSLLSRKKVKKGKRKKGQFLLYKPTEKLFTLRLRERERESVCDKVCVWAYRWKDKKRSGVCKSVELISKVFSKLYVVVSPFPSSLSVQKTFFSSSSGFQPHGLLKYPQKKKKNFTYNPRSGEYDFFFIDLSYLEYPMIFITYSQG